MTQDEIIEMARQAWISDKEAQLITEFDEAYLSCTYLTDLVAFAKLVDAKATAKEREACAKVCIEHGKVWGERMLLGFQATLDDAAEAIRARGEA